jgi:hypothetical protein
MSIVTVVFALVLVSFFFPDELKPYWHLELDERYLPSFQALSWLIFVMSALLGITGFVVQCRYGSV